MEQEEKATAGIAHDDTAKNHEVNYTLVTIPRTKTKYKVRKPLNITQLEAIAKLLYKKGSKPLTTESEIIQDIKVASKAAAIYVLPGFWQRKFAYWLLWRWFYYIKQYDNMQLLPIISEGLDSTPYVDFLRVASLLVNQKDTQMRMTVSEAEKMLQELAHRTNKEAEFGKE